MMAPAQIRRLPQDRSTRPRVPLDAPIPPGCIVDTMSPGLTRIDVRTRPDGDLASTVHGKSGIAAVSIGKTPLPAAYVPIVRSFTTRVTASDVPFEIPRVRMVR